MKNETYYKSCTYIIILIRNILIKHDYEKKINVSVNFLRKIEKSIRNKILYYTSNLKKNWILNSLHSYKEIYPTSPANFPLFRGYMVNYDNFYLELVYFVTALVPSETACLANSPGNIKRTAVWISLEEMVERLL